MNPLKLFKEKAAQVEKIMDKRSGILASYLFGSFATGRTEPESDVDIAILYDKDTDYNHSVFKEELRLGYELEKLLSDESDGRREVDILNLNRANLLLKHKVLKEGGKNYVRDKRKVVLFESYVISRYCDFRPTLDLIDRYYIDGKLKRAEFN